LRTLWLKRDLRVREHEAAARLARQRIQLVRRESMARDQSRTIYRGHSSRRRPVQRGPGRRTQHDLFDDGA